MDNSSDNLCKRILDVIATDIIPLTRQSAKLGNKIFSAAILKKSDTSLVLAKTNAEIENLLISWRNSYLKFFFSLT